MPKNTSIVHLSKQVEYRLTALWALSESGLGGVMHALKIPFAGFFLGGFAIVIIILMAHYAVNPFKAILRATLLVMIVKATASPHSPPMAYIAVAFQGFCGAICLSYIAWEKLGAILFGFLALLESAAQKFLITTLIFGKSVWEALDAFFISITKDFALPSDFSFSFWLIALYTGVYCIWGASLGWWASGLAKTMDSSASQLFSLRSSLGDTTTSLTTPLKVKRSKKIIYLASVLLFICSVFVYSGIGHKAVYSLLRTIAALLLIYWVIAPLSRWALQLWLSRKRKQEQQHIDQLLQLIPVLKTYITVSLQLAKLQSTGIAVYKNFVVNLIILSLYEEKELPQ